ncbi:MAG TPA: glutamine--fructose-6-phosphate transaminase (isomerizing) [Firmicutes bacterium]|nr:glutamine--fructose-6-phosphate transaminase (isomerizing) [Bacillota bacterium]
MCGILGYIGGRNAYDILIEGLKKLEYRGYDSAGAATLAGGKVNLVKTAGRLNCLEAKVPDGLPGNIGIGHTRFATHGRPSDENSHPHTGCFDDFIVVHNGIIENYRELKEWLQQEGHSFSSETDTEVLAHLLEVCFEGDLLQALMRVLEKIKGSYALVVLSPRQPEVLACARKDSPLVIGCGTGENFIASDIPAILDYTDRVIILEDGEMALVSQEEVRVFGPGGEEKAKKEQKVTWSVQVAEKGGYPHFMLKEIHEQPQAIRDTLRGRIDENLQVVLPELDDCRTELKEIDKIFIIACGTAYHAGLVGKYWLEKLSGVPVEVELASEFRYFQPLLTGKNLALVISQSGETADTLAALRLIKEKGCRVVAVTNVVGSTVAREADNVIFTWAGPEIAVASTKAYITQLAVLYLFSLYLAGIRETLPQRELENLTASLRDCPNTVASLLAEAKEKAIEQVAEELAGATSAFYLGRGPDYAVAMEGALKLKEVSYIHAEAYAAGELKHGPVALVTEGVPVVALGTQDHVFDKNLSNIKEVKARQGSVLAVVFEDRADSISGEVDRVFTLPNFNPLLAPVLAVVPLQLLAYYTAIKRGCDVDKPRNLAKSVTVE